MSLIEMLPRIIEESRAEYEEAVAGSFPETAYVGGDSTENVLAAGDNMAFMKALKSKFEESGNRGIQMIYIDPPFFSKSNYGSEIKLSSEKLGKLPTIKQFAYHDSWEEGTFEYLKMLCTRFYMMKDLLADDGCLWVHLDWHIVHYVKILLDEVFGEKNFVNEVIWQYKSGGSSKKHYSRKHDTLLFYAKGKNYYFQAQQEKSYNRGYKPYRFKGVKEYRDETGWYTMVNMKDVWQIDMVGRTSGERTGYATQKPEALIMRILESCTRPGDLVADFFGGSGTLCAAAEKMGRKWLYCDLGALATGSAVKRLSKEGSTFLISQESSTDFGECEIEAEAVLETAGVTESGLLTVRITDYKVNEHSDIPVDDKSVPIIKDAMEKDPLAFIDFWSIDYSYDGSVHRADETFGRDKNGIALEAVKLGGVKPGTFVNIRVYDVFGNTAEKTLEIK